jgi:hypothetical protein
MKARGVKPCKYHESKRRRSLHSRDEWQRALVYTGLTTMTSMDTQLALHDCGERRRRRRRRRDLGMPDLVALLRHGALVLKIGPFVVEPARASSRRTGL